MKTPNTVPFITYAVLMLSVCWTTIMDTNEKGCSHRVKQTDFSVTCLTIWAKIFRYQILETFTSNILNLAQNNFFFLEFFFPQSG